MSAMELFRSRIEQSAKAAADAAKQLSSLDDMAQNDDYIQSEGLRISEKKKVVDASPNNSELPSVVEDLSGAFVDAFSGAARKHNRPRPNSHEKIDTSAKTENLARPSEQIEAAGRRKSKSREGNNMTRPKSVQQQQPKPTTQKPQLISSVAELYNRNNAIDTTPKQSATKGGRTKQPAPRVNTRQGTHDGRHGKSSKASQNKLSLSTIPSSPGQHKNVLLVNKHAHILHELDYDSDDSSDDEQQTGKNSQSDIEMGRLGNNAALHDQLEQELEETITRQNSQNSPPNNDVKEKDVHRFMRMTADLESEREVLIESLNTVPETSTTNNYIANNNTPANPNGLDSWDKLRGTAGEETNKALRAGFSWVKNVASPQLEAISQQIMTKVSEADNIRKSSNTSAQQRPKSQPMIGSRHTPSAKNEFEEEKFTVSTSASFLADDDMAELERIRARNSTSKLTAYIQMCIDNPRLGFIVVTLFVALFAYFYSRHKSVDDVL